MADYPCDNDHGVVAQMSITNFATADTQFWCVSCGMALMIELAALSAPQMILDKAAELAPPATVATPAAGGNTADPDDAPEPPRRSPRKGRDVHVPPIDFDVHRTIGEVVEDAPRPPSGEDQSGVDDYANRLLAEQDEREASGDPLDMAGSE